MWKRLLIGLGAVVLVGVLGVVTYFYGLHPKVAEPPEIAAPETPEAIARGKYLANHMLGCVQCHSPIDETRPGDFIVEGKLLAGRPIPAEGFPGTVVAQNLSSDEEHGVGAWTDGELMRAIREGISRDGRPLFPFMPYHAYRHLSDADTLAIIAYLRQAPPQTNDPGDMQVDFPISMFARTEPHPVEGDPGALSEEKLERGRRLLTLMVSADCHTQRERGQPIEGMTYAGGVPFEGPFGTVYSTNITSSEAAGIGAYTDADLRRVFRHGVNKAGRKLWVMPWSAYQGLTDQDLDALIAAVRDIPPNDNLVKPPELKEGFEVYADQGVSLNSATRSGPRRSSSAAAGSGGAGGAPRTSR